MKYASVCSGVEAASLAWEPLGWKPAWFSEIEPFPCAVLKKRYPGVPNLGDMTKIKVENLKNGDQRFTNGIGADVVVPGGVNLLVGGTPCQGFSVAGKQGGLNDERSVLCLTFTRLLDAMRPEWFVWENVPGVFSTNGGEDFKAFLRAIDEIGYSCAWRVLDAQYTRVDGYPRAVPQRRRRVFVVGHLGTEWEYPAEVLFEPSCLCRNHPPQRVKGKGFTTIAKRSIGAAEAVMCYENHAQDSRVKELDGVCSQISAKAGTGGNNLPLVRECYVKTARPKFAGDCETYVDTGVAPTVNTFDQGDKRANELVCEGVMPNLTVRRLLPVECERLMGFPDNWTRIPWKGKPAKKCPDSPRYKACGNSMCVNVMRWIGMKIEIVERNKR